MAASDPPNSQPTDDPLDRPRPRPEAPEVPEDRRRPGSRTGAGNLPWAGADLDPDVTVLFPSSGTAAGGSGERKEGVGLEDCVRELSDSGLMDDAQIAALRERIAGKEGTPDAQALVRELVRAGRLTAYQAGAVLQGKSRGLQIGNYLVLDKLGAGGMGMVFKAEHRRLKRIVALKLLPPSLARDPSAVRRFQREAKAAAKLSHANVVAVLDADEFQGLHFLVMEYLEGRDLGRLVAEEGPLSVPQAIDCVVQAARGLKAAADAGVVHRDIKPSNLLLEPSGSVKVLDMGLARFDEGQGQLGGIAADAGLTQSNLLVGTVDYMSPEQALDPRLADLRSDIYSLGCTLYFLLTGRAPFQGETVVARLIAHREHPIPRLTANRPELGPDFDALMSRVLAKSPHDRFATLDELIAGLQKCRMSFEEDAKRKALPGGAAPPKDETPSLQALPADASARRRLVLAGGVLAAAVLLVGLGTIVFLKGTGARRDRVSSQPKSPTSIAPAPAATRRPILESEPARSELTSAPDHVQETGPTPKKAATVTAESMSGARLPESETPVIFGVSTALEGHQGRVNAIAVSGDGRRALSGGQDGTIRLWDLASGKSLRTVAQDGPVVAVALSSDGRLGLSGAMDRSVRVWEFLPDGEVGVHRFEGHTGPVTAVVLAHGGRTVLSGSSDRTVRVWDIAAHREDGPPLTHESPVGALAATTGESALAGCDDGTLWLWDIRSHQRILRLRTPGAVLCVALVPSGRRAISGHRDGLLVLWDLEQGMEAGRMVGHGDLVRCAAFSADGRRLLAGSQAGILLLWDVETRRILHRFPHPEPAQGTSRSGQLGVAVLSDGLHALTADTDARIRPWELPGIQGPEDDDSRPAPP